MIIMHDDGGVGRRWCVGVCTINGWYDDGWGGMHICIWTRVVVVLLRGTTPAPPKMKSKIDSSRFKMLAVFLF